MGTVAIYCRVSTQMQSSDRQIKDLLAFANKEGYAIDDENIYVDIISGYSISEQRPQYKALKDEINKGNIKKVLFSELTRLGRNATELLAEIEKLQKKGVDLYFEKQDFWARSSEKDLGSRILLSVLAFTSTYEVELFAERSVSGKIEKASKGGGIGGDNNAYGYCNDKEKKMQKRVDEALVVSRIFEMYAEGKSTIDICETLNAERIPTAYQTRIKEFKEGRKKKGLSPKKYTFDDDEKFSWRPSTIARMLSNDLYTGHRKIVFHKPQVDKMQDGEEREVFFTVDKQFEDLRIISDELFVQVQQRLAQAKYNKNNACKHDNLLKDKIICGECGSNFSVGKQSSTPKNGSARSYKCYGRVSRKDKPQNCQKGAEVNQWKLDGLVLTLSLQMFAEINITETTDKQIDALTEEITQAERVKNLKQQQLQELREEHKRQIDRLSKANDKSDDIISDLIEENKEKFKQKSSELSESIAVLGKEITTKRITIEELRRLATKFVNLKDKMDEIWHSKELVKSMIHEYINRITIYRINKLWNLVVVKYNNNTEFWGTIKSARYKKDEMFADPLLCQHGIEYQAWMLNNTEHCFQYNRDIQTISFNGQSELYTFQEGEYSYEQLDEILRANGWIGSFPLYDYETQSTCIRLPEEPKPDFLSEPKVISSGGQTKSLGKQLEYIKKHPLANKKANKRN